jgi:hypothetical protein
MTTAEALKAEALARETSTADDQRIEHEQPETGDPEGPPRQT